MKKPILPKLFFRIQHLDRFFQGVSKEDDQITFVKRALEEERGIALVEKKKKKVLFSKVETLETSSNKRVKPDCPHYSQCSACHCLHLNYSDELEQKEQTFKLFLKNYLGKFQRIAGKRTHYRNRVQLHYHQPTKKVGFKSFKNLQDIINIPDCQIMEPQVKTKYLELLKQIPKTRSPQGHIEIYHLNDQIYVNLNKPYAHQGFSQVNKQLNNEVKRHLSTIFEEYNLNSPSKSCMDLFGGDGNLSSSLKLSKRIIIDNSPREIENYKQLNLYNIESIESIRDHQKEPLDIMIINPPRMGFKHLSSYIETFQPEYLLYMSCDIATLKRDLDSIENRSFKCLESWLIDFFPGTYHFESLVLLEFFK